MSIVNNTKKANVFWGGRLGGINELKNKIKLKR